MTEARSWPSRLHDLLRPLLRGGMEPDRHPRQDRREAGAPSCQDDAKIVLPIHRLPPCHGRDALVFSRARHVAPDLPKLTSWGGFIKHRSLIKSETPELPSGYAHDNPRGRQGFEASPCY